MAIPSDIPIIQTLIRMLQNTNHNIPAVLVLLYIIAFEQALYFLALYWRQKRIFEMQSATLYLSGTVVFAANELATLTHVRSRIKGLLRNAKAYKIPKGILGRDLCNVIEYGMQIHNMF